MEHIWEKDFSEQRAHLGRVGEVDDHAAGKAAAHGAGRDHFHLVRVLRVPEEVIVTRAVAVADVAFDVAVTIVLVLVIDMQLMLLFLLILTTSPSFTATII